MAYTLGLMRHALSPELLFLFWSWAANFEGHGTGSVLGSDVIRWFDGGLMK